MKIRPFTVAACELNFTAEKFGELPRYGQAKTSAAVFSGSPAIYLLKSLEDLHLLVIGDAHAGVFDGKSHGPA